MSYSYSLKYRTSLNKEFMRFEIKIVFCFLLMLFLMYANFYWALGFLLVLLVAATLTYKFFKKSNSNFIRFIFQAEHEYEESFPGREASVSLIGFICAFVVIWAFHYFINFPADWALIIGLMNICLANNLAALILWKAKTQYVIYGTTLEFLILSSVVGTLVFLLFGMPYYIAIFLAFGGNLFSLLPINHNFTNFLVTSLLFMLLFI